MLKPEDPKRYQLRFPKERSLEELVEEGLKQSLGPYLYENISCGETLLCRDAVKVNPWVDVQV